MKHQEIHLPTPDPEHPYAGDGRYRFPDINGMNLLGDNVSLPPIMPKSFHIMLTVFHPEALYSMKHGFPSAKTCTSSTSTRPLRWNTGFCWFSSLLP